MNRFNKNDRVRVKSEVLENAYFKQAYTNLPKENIGSVFGYTENGLVAVVFDIKMDNYLFYPCDLELVNDKSALPPTPPIVEKKEAKPPLRDITVYENTPKFFPFYANKDNVTRIKRMIVEKGEFMTFWDRVYLFFS